MMKEEAEYFSENLQPTRLLSCRKEQKIYLENWHLYSSYVDGSCRRFLRKVGTYMMSYIKIYKKYQPGMLITENLIF